MADSREEEWRGVADYGEDKSKIYSMIWHVYTKYKEQFIKRKFLLAVPHPKGGNIVWTCVQDHIIEGKEYYGSI